MDPQRHARRGLRLTIDRAVTAVPPRTDTVRRHLAWSYANLGRAHAALLDGAVRYGRVHHMIRNKLFHGLCSGTLNPRTTFDDERLKITLPKVCSYCGADGPLSLDHLVARFAGGDNSADNLVLCCRRCNSSKGNLDLIEWFFKNDGFPSLLLLRRYLKLLWLYCEANDLMEASMRDVPNLRLPFAIELVPHEFPPLEELRLWVGRTD